MTSEPSKPKPAPKRKSRSTPQQRRLQAKGIPIVNRPWSALTKHQRDLRLDTLAAWHERDIFTDDLVDNYDKRVSERAKRSTEVEMRAMVRAHKMGIDLSTPGIVGRLLKENDWASSSRRPTPRRTRGRVSLRIGGHL